MKQGFTLLELLITIAILAVLTTVIVVAINPAESIKRARDTQRMSDIDNLKSAVILWLSEGETAIGGDATGGCCIDVVGGVTCNAEDICESDDGGTPTSVTGNGWIPIAFTGMAGGSPLSHLPQDPLNSDDNLYFYVANGTDFELNARMESAYYTTGKEINKVMKKDGGNTDNLYEVGTKLTILKECLTGVECPTCTDPALPTETCTVGVCGCGA